MSLIQFTQCLIVSKFQLLHLSHLHLTPPPLFPQPKSKILLILIIHLRISESTIHWGYICSLTASSCWISTYMYMYLHCNRRPGYLKLFNSGGTFDHSGGTSICCIFWDNLSLLSLSSSKHDLWAIIYVLLWFSLGSQEKSFLQVSGWKVVFPWKPCGNS